MRPGERKAMGNANSPVYLVDRRVVEIDGFVEALPRNGMGWSASRHPPAGAAFSCGSAGLFKLRGMQFG
jgi:hypothetical protein